MILPQHVRNEVIERCNQVFPKVINIRRQIHQHPELGFEEQRTSSLIMNALEELGLEVRGGIAKTGVVARLEGLKKDSGKTLLLRADMDALPLQEEVDLPFKSVISGKMHACGHDGHSAVLLGVAEILTNMRRHLDGEVKLVFQPAEETSGGARPMVKEGVLENPRVTAALALHFHHDIPTGKIGIKKGSVTASADGFRIILYGPGGHGSAPHQTRDLAHIGVQLFNILHSLPSREIDPMKPVVLTIGKYQVGTRYNIIASKAVIEGTIRTFEEEVRQYLKQRIIDVSSEIARHHEVKVDVQFNIGHAGYKPGWNDPNFTEFVADVIEEGLGKSTILWQDRPFMGAEDFFEFSQDKQIPACLFFVGTRNEHEGCVYPLHSTRFKLDEKAMLVAMKALATCVLAYLQ